MEKDNRKSGWQFAKLSGHLNEKIVTKLLMEDQSFSKDFLKKINKEDCKIISATAEGLNQLSIESVLGGLTKPKTDLFVELNDGSSYNISIKKSASGQVYLISVNHFIEGYEKQYNQKIPEDIKRAIQLYWGSANDVLEIIKKFGDSKTEKYEKKKNRIVADTLKHYNQELYNSLITWFKQNIKNIFDFCFSKGLVKDKSGWVDLVWYINKTEKSELNDIFFIPDLINSIDSEIDYKIIYGDRLGGTTIQLPFGFVQWHSPKKIIPGSIQFHHKFTKIQEIKKKI